MNFLKKNRKEIGFEALFATHEEAVARIWGASEVLKSFSLSENENAAVRSLYFNAPKVPISGDSRGYPYYAKNYDESTYNRLNKNHMYRDCSALANQLHKVFRPHISLMRSAVKSPFRIVNVRAWETAPEASSFGPNDWHMDGFPPGHMKIMVYLDGLGGGQGKLEVQGVEDLAGPPGISVLFQNSEVLHRAVPPESAEASRPVLEVTLLRLLADPNEDVPMVGTPNDRHLRSPLLAYDRRT